MKLILSLLCIFFGMNQMNCNEYQGAVNRYVDFINRIAHGEEFSQYEEAASLIAPECRKIFNGRLAAADRDTFVSDLLLVHKTYGCWTIYPTDIIISSENNAAVLRLIIEMEKLGSFNAIVILRYNAQGLVTEINEVFNRIEEAYNFEEVSK